MERLEQLYKNIILKIVAFLGNKGCNEILNITKPEVIKEIHLKYIEAGADIIETNSFNSNRISLSEYNLEERSYEFAKIKWRVSFRGKR